MRILLVAAPGAGKGTQAIRIEARYGITHISSGELLRSHVGRGTAIGRQVQRYVAAGDLVPDEIVIAVLAEPVLEAAESGGYVLDGFPRTAHQAQVAYELAAPREVEVQRTVFLDVPQEELLRRLFHRARAEGRVDDTEEVIRHRLEVFAKSADELIEYYETRGVLARVDGTGSVDDVSARLWAVLDPFRNAADA